MLMFKALSLMLSLATIQVKKKDEFIIKIFPDFF